MKTMLPLLFLLCAGCEREQESLIRPEAVRETAANAGKLEEERILEEIMFQPAANKVEMARRQVMRAGDARELALAEDELREARRELEKIKDRLEELAD